MPESATGLPGLTRGRSLGTSNTQSAGLVASRSGFGWIVAFVGIQLGCQVALLAEDLAPLRVVFRSLAFCTSLLFLLVIRGSRRKLEFVDYAAVAVIGIFTLSVFNPLGGAPLAIAAHWAICLAIIAPLFWVRRLALDERQLGHLLLILWAFHTLSAVVGLLQVFFPGQFRPATSIFVGETHALMIRLPSGDWVPRPMGLSDVPGGAASAGLFSSLIGLGVVLSRPFRGATAVGIASMVIGMACIHLSQIRAVLVMLGICFIVVIAIFAWSGRIPRLAWSLLAGGLVILLGFEVAFDLGGDTVTDRLSSLIQHDPGTVYRANRGRMLEYAWSTLLPEYPLGAGLGHWGMMNAYFGGKEHEIGAELQWVGWLLDGGVPLILAYLVAILAAIHGAVRASLRAHGTPREGWTTIVAGYGVGTLALCFSYAPFIGTAGLEFWLLNAILLQTERLRGT
jgi:hypothetical protein